jgi:hypothetical protein
VVPLVCLGNLGLALLQQIKRRFGPLNCAERFHQNTARQIAGLVAAHTVRYDPEAGIRAHQARILVALTHLAGVCQAADVKA